jgi:hypothetical membrane protein
VNETTVNDPKSRGLMTRSLLACGVIGPPLFVLVFLIEGATRPGYNPWRNWVSELSLGELGLMQIANFVVFGLLALGFAIGLRQVLRIGRGSLWGPILVAAFGLCLILAGIFVTTRMAATLLALRAAAACRERSTTSPVPASSSR